MESTVLLFLLLYGCVAIVTGQNTTLYCCVPEPSGLDSAEIASIFLGAMLFLLLIIGAIICYKKVCAKDEPESKISPVIMGFSTSPEKLKCQTQAAIEMETLERQKRSGRFKDPIIYMNDDIYHPPKSRPLPTDQVPQSEYRVFTEDHSSRTVSQNQRTKNTKRASNRPKPRRLRSTSTDQGEGTSQNSSRTTSIKGHLIFPDNERIDFTTQYDVMEPYRY